jgi:hypothetical protein
MKLRGLQNFMIGSRTVGRSAVFIVLLTGVSYGVTFTSQFMEKLGEKMLSGMCRPNKEAEVDGESSA